MRFYLLKDWEYEFPEELSQLEPNSINKVIEVHSQFLMTNVPFYESNDILQFYLARVQPIPAEISWDFRLKVGIRTGNDSGQKAKLYLIPHPRRPHPLSTPILEKLVRLFPNEVKVNISIDQFGSVDTRNNASFKIEAPGVIPNRDGICFQDNITIPDMGVIYKNHERHVGCITISVDVPSTVCGPAHILENPTPPNATINAANGAVVECDYSVLSGYRKHLVFSALSGRNMFQWRKKTIDMKEVSEIGVRAILDYLYCEDMKAAEDDPNIAFELFQAARNYKFEELEKAVTNVLLATKLCKISVDLAIKIFYYARNVDGITARSLKYKMAKVLKSKLDEFQTSNAYKNLTIQHPHVARALALYVAVEDVQGDQTYYVGMLEM